MFSIQFMFYIIKLKCDNTFNDVKSKLNFIYKFIILISPRMLAIYFQLNLFSKSHQKPPCDGRRSEAV
jgi:hypothetical protein